MYINIYIDTRLLLRKIIIVFDQTRRTYTTFIYCTVLQIYSKRAALSLSQQYLQKYLQTYSDNKFNLQLKFYTIMQYLKGVLDFNC